LALGHDDVFGHYATADGLRIHYGDIGEGPPVICLHGTGPGSGAWVNFRHNIEDLSKRFRVLAVDLPRFGKSEKVVVEKPRATFLSGVVRALMDEIGVDRASFIGNSMGGQVALKLAADTPERVDRLVLVGPAVMDVSVFTPMPTETMRLIMGYYKGEGPTLDKMRTVMRNLVYDADSVTEEQVRERYEASVDPEVLEVNRGPHWKREPLEPHLGRVQAPTLIVWGQDDRASALDHGLLLLRKLPDARMHIFARCGHSAQAEHAAEFNALATSFFEG
jgi:4,5:9,10-diseco-3-hydroxy-5,9,17-trioxoandrosta-1(10),2-diene-4-oate hydrolase